MSAKFAKLPLKRLRGADYTNSTLSLVTVLIFMTITLNFNYEYLSIFSKINKEILIEKEKINK